MMERKQSRQGAVIQGNKGMRLLQASGSLSIARVFGPKSGNMVASTPAILCESRKKKETKKMWQAKGSCQLSLLFLPFFIIFNQENWFGGKLHLVTEGDISLAFITLFPISY